MVVEKGTTNIATVLKATSDAQSITKAVRAPSPGPKACRLHDARAQHACMEGFDAGSAVGPPRLLLPKQCSRAGALSRNSCADYT